jgi:hypothetical protein
VLKGVCVEAVRNRIIIKCLRVLNIFVLRHCSSGGVPSGSYSDKYIINMTSKKNTFLITIVILLSSCGGGGASTTPTSNVAPTASIGQIVTPVLTGSVSSISGIGSDANGDVLTYRWSLKQKPSGSSIGIGVIGTERNLQFTPDASGSFTISLVVNDGTVNSQEATLTFAANSLPVIGGGSLPIKNLLLGPPILLDASASSDPDGNQLSFKWSFYSKPSSSSSQIASPTLSATSVTPDVVGKYELLVEVSNANSKLSQVRTFNVSSTDREGPTASAISLNSTRVNTSVSGKELIATIRIADATGYDTSQLPMSYAKRYGAPYVTNISSWRLVSGDFKDGVYEFKVTIPVGAQPGNWLFSVWSHQDTIGNLAPEFYTDFVVE